MSGPVAPACVVLVDKPAGPTSFDIVRRARRGLQVRVGHAGTLDPFASGLLLILVGQATRVSNLLMERPKRYEVTVQFGAVSSTADPTGEIVSTGKRVGGDEVAAALEAFRGVIRQRVPLTSAVKVGGEALYRRAHRGESVETPEREVTVHELTLLGFDEGEQSARLVAVTSSGTYVRTLAEDLGDATGAGAYAFALRRTHSGDLSVVDALDPDELSPEHYRAGVTGVMPVAEALSFLPSYAVSDRQARLVANGNELRDLPGDDLLLLPKGRFQVSGPEGLLAIYERHDRGARPAIVFAHPL